MKAQIIKSKTDTSVWVFVNALGGLLSVTFAGWNYNTRCRGNSFYFQL